MEEAAYALNVLCWVLDGFDGNVRRADLLGYTAGLAVLNIGSPQLVEYFRFSGIYVSQHTNHRRPENVQSLFLLRLDTPILYSYSYAFLLSLSVRHLVVKAAVFFALLLGLGFASASRIRIALRGLLPTSLLVALLGRLGRFFVRFRWLRCLVRFVWNTISILFILFC